MDDSQNNEITFRRVLPYALLSTILILSCWVVGCVVGINTPSVSVHYTQQFMVKSNIITNAAAYMHTSIIEMLLIFIINALLGYCFLTLGASNTILRYLVLPVNMYGGYKIGAIIAPFVINDGIRSVLLRLVPHGVFELSAVFICVGIGILLAYDLTKGKRRDPKYSNKGILHNAKHFYYYKIVPIFFIAALIETYVTALIYQIFK